MLIAQIRGQLRVGVRRAGDEFLLKMLNLDAIGTDDHHGAGHDAAPAAAIYRFPKSRSATGADTESRDENRDQRGVPNRDRVASDALAQDLFELLQSGSHEGPHRISHKCKSVHFDFQTSKNYPQ